MAETKQVSEKFCCSFECFYEDGFVEGVDELQGFSQRFVVSEDSVSVFLTGLEVVTND